MPNFEAQYFSVPTGRVTKKNPAKQDDLEVLVRALLHGSELICLQTKS